jgi:ubiquinone biosynthesis protein COQ4
MAEQLRRDPACAELIEARWIPPAHDLEQLAALPEGSLGQAYAASLARLGYDPNLHAGMAPDSDAAYVELRLSQTHDLWHVVTGFDTTVTGEIGLQAFHLTQFPYPLGAVLTAQALVSATLGAPELLPELVEAIRTGLQMGLEARPLFAQRWEEGWQRPLVEWREALQLRPFAERVGQL